MYYLGMLAHQVNVFCLKVRYNSSQDTFYRGFWANNNMLRIFPLGSGVVVHYNKVYNSLNCSSAKKPFNATGLKNIIHKIGYKVSGKLGILI